MYMYLYSSYYDPWPVNHPQNLPPPPSTSTQLPFKLNGHITSFWDACTCVPPEPWLVVYVSVTTGLATITFNTGFIIYEGRWGRGSGLCHGRPSGTTRLTLAVGLGGRPWCIARGLGRLPSPLPFSFFLSFSPIVY